MSLSLTNRKLKKSPSEQKILFASNYDTELKKNGIEINEFSIVKDLFNDSNNSDEWSPIKLSHSTPNLFNHKDNNKKLVKSRSVTKLN